ncbi:Asp23/Gls24 family envelope stress response protein [Actinomadura monticuli]|uniref:Asp23/Gls24 family envelope stress response protein n=1 Tax=Actinomadura monticuli TaxID=3097367 RepID=A0ABV4QN49_9ACTN
MTGLDKRQGEGGEPRPDPGSMPYFPGLPGAGPKGPNGTVPPPGTPLPPPGTPLPAPAGASAPAAGAVPMTMHGSPGDVTVRVEGRITIEDAVLEKIAALAALEVAGVSGPAPAGTRVAVGEEDVTVELAIAVEYGCVIKDVAHRVQDNVARVASQMLGTRVAAVNVSVGDVRMPAAAPPRPRAVTGQSGTGQSGTGQTARA